MQMHDSSALFPIKLSTGSLDFNNWLNGGYETGIITLLYGPAGSGKSNFAILASVAQAQKGKKVIFIDTEGSFSVERIHQLAPQNAEFILNNILILKPTSFSEQKKTFAQLSLEIKNSQNLGLVVVDSLTMLYRLELAAARKKNLADIQEVNAELSKQMNILHEIARKKNIAAIITGQVYNEFLSEEDWLGGKEASVSLVGGDILKYWSKCVIELQKKDTKRTALIRKHRSIEEKTINFEIVNEGIRKKG